jgi:hypothetical protein
MKIGKWVIVVMYCLLICQEVYAGDLPPHEMQEWFISRLLWTPIFGIGFSIMAFYWTKRIKHEPPEVSIRSKVRKRFSICFIFALLISCGWLIADVIYIYSFQTALILKESLQVLFSWQAVVILLTMSAGFWITAAISSRFWASSEDAF